MIRYSFLKCSLVLAYVILVVRANSTENPPNLDDFSSMEYLNDDYYRVQENAFEDTTNSDSMREAVVEALIAAEAAVEKQPAKADADTVHQSKYPKPMDNHYIVVERPEDADVAKKLLRAAQYYDTRKSMRNAMPIESWNGPDYEPSLLIDSTIYPEGFLSALDPEFELCGSQCKILINRRIVPDEWLARADAEEVVRMHAKVCSWQCPQCCILEWLFDGLIL